MNEDKLLKLLKVSIFIGLTLLVLGIYLHLFSEKMSALGVTGIIISASCIAAEGGGFSLYPQKFT